MKKEIVVGLMGHSFHCTNLGVGALAISECSILKSVADELGVTLKVICFEANKGKADYRKATEVDVSLDYCTYSPRMIRKYKQCDMIIDATGGDSFSDIYGSKIFCAGILFKTYALLSGRPVILAPQTIGPFYKKINGLIANIYMKFVKKIFLRDEISVKVISSANRKKVENVADMAFRLPFTGDVDRKIVGFNVSGLLYDESSDLLKNSQLDYRLLCEKIIDLLISCGKKVVLVSHVLGDDKTATDNDYYASLELKKKYPQIELAPVFNNPVEAKNYISSLDFFIGSRMHAVIAAVSSGVPAVPIAYSRKFKGVFEPLEYDVTLDATKMSTEKILEKVNFYIEHQEILDEKVSHTFNHAQMKLNEYESFLKIEMSEILNRG